MSGQASLDAIADRLRALAAERGWQQVTDVLDSSPAADDGGLLVLTPGGEIDEAVAGWLGEATGATVGVDQLEPYADTPAAALSANRLMIVVRCGELLSATAAAAARSVVARPRASLRILISGAELIGDAADLDLVERGLWRLVLAGDDDGDWAGQSLAERGCLLWALPATTVAPLITERVAAARADLQRWLTSPLPTDAVEALAGLRVRAALELAADAERRERPVSLPASGQTSAVDPLAGRLAAQRDAVRRVRQRLLRRLDADLDSLERQLAVGLDTTEQDLLSGLGSALARGRGHHDGPAGLERFVAGYVAEATAAWSASAGRLLGGYVAGAGASLRELGADVDWALVNETVGPPASGVGLPESLLAALIDWDAAGLASAVTSGDPLGSAGGGAPVPGAGRSWAGGLRMTVAGALIGGMTGALLPIVLPTVAAGALGAAGGHLLDRHLGDVEAERQAEVYARAVITATIGEAVRRLRPTLYDAAMPLRRGLADGLDGVAASLERAAASPDTATNQRPAVTAPPTGASVDRAISNLIDELASQLAVAGPPPVLSRPRNHSEEDESR